MSNPNPSNGIWELSAVLKEVEKKAEPEEKLVVKKKDLATGTKFVVLKA